jgi:hypothetical protein
MDSRLMLFGKGESHFCLSKVSILAYFSVYSGVPKWYTLTSISQSRVTSHVPLASHNRIWCCWCWIQVWWCLIEDNIIFTYQNYQFWPLLAFSQNETKWNILILILQSRVISNISIVSPNNIWCCWRWIQVWWWLDKENLIFACREYQFWHIWAFSHEET